MKKTIALTAAGLGAALFATGCLPPGEVDSDVKVKTATEVEAPTATTSAKAGKDAAEKTDGEKTSTTSQATTTVTAQDDAEAMDPSGIRFINCVGKPEGLPTSMWLSCTDESDKLNRIQWTKVTATKAEGVAERVTNDCNPSCAEGTATTNPEVKVELSDPIETAEGVVFSKVAVDGTDIAFD